MSTTRTMLLSLVGLTLGISSAQGNLLISQYYEGGASNKYIELWNSGTTPISLGDYSLALYSNAFKQAWKTDGATPTRAAALPATVILQPGNYYLLRHSDATLPAYTPSIVNQSDKDLINFNGDDSVVLWKKSAAPYSPASDLADVVSIIGATTSPSGLGDKSIRRISTGVGYGLGTDSGSWNEYPTVWEVTPTVASSPVVNDATNLVAVAGTSDTWRLAGYLAGVAPTLASFTIANDLATTVSPRVVLNFSTSGDNPTDYRVSADQTFADTTWTAITSQGRVLYQLSPGLGDKTIYLQVRNATGESGLQSDTITLAAPSTTPPVLITQYYEGTGNNKYIELTNTSGSPVDMTDWRLFRWTNQDRALWAYTGVTASGSSVNISLAALGTLNPQQTVLIGHNSAALGGATPNLSTGEMSFNGDDTVALYSGVPGTDTLVDAVVFGVVTTTLNEGENTSLKRLSTAAGFDFATAASAPTFPSVWGTVSLDDVAAAAAGSSDNHLGTYFLGPPLTGFAAWQASVFSGVTDPLIVGFNADPDRDGIPNGVEYAMGTNPSAAVNVFTDLSKGTGTFVARHSKNLSATGVTLAYQWSTDLQQWSLNDQADGTNRVTFTTQTISNLGNLSVEEVTATVQEGTPSRLYVRAIAVQN
jgi:hypothetical protein